MLTLVAVPLICWLCALVARPRRPLLGHEVQELVYVRLCGKQQRLVLLALLTTFLMLPLFLITTATQMRSDPSQSDDMLTALSVTQPTTPPSIQRCFPGDGRCLP